MTKLGNFLLKTHCLCKKYLFVYLSNLYIQSEVQTHNPEIRSRMFFGGSQPGIPFIILFIRNPKFYFCFSISFVH